MVLSSSKHVQSHFVLLFRSRSLVGPPKPMLTAERATCSQGVRGSNFPWKKRSNDDMDWYGLMWMILEWYELIYGGYMIWMILEWRWGLSENRLLNWVVHHHPWYQKVPFGVRKTTCSDKLIWMMWILDDIYDMHELIWMILRALISSNMFFIGEMARTWCHHFFWLFDNSGSCYHFAPEETSWSGHGSEYS